MDRLISEESIRQKILLETKRNISGKYNAINIYEPNKEHGVKSKKIKSREGISLVVQWLRIHLAMQET